MDAFTRLQSQADQISTARRGLAPADEALRLARQRQEFAVAVVLENILAEQDLTGARTDYLKAITEYNKAQLDYEANQELSKEGLIADLILKKSQFTLQELASKNEMEKKKVQSNSRSAEARLAAQLVPSG